MSPSPVKGDHSATQVPAIGDTIVALSSGRPPAAVAIIRTSGPHVVAILEAVTGRAAPAPRNAVLRQLSDPATGQPLDDALVLRFAAPASATGEDIVEYQCHGGRAVVERLLDVLASQDGARLAQPGEFTRRALANGRIDLTEAEGLADLIEAETEAQRKAALLVAEGGIRRQVGVWRVRLLSLSARAEAAIDYVGDEDETAINDRALAEEAEALAAEIDIWLARPRAERLKDGIRIVAAGPPNAGKSSLVNALSESDRAIVTALPGTTRDVIEIPFAIGGIALLLVDTAGLRSSGDEVERIGVARAEAEMARADILLWLGEPDAAPPHERLIRIYPRIDQPGRARIPDGTLGVSAFAGTGLTELREAIAQKAAGLVPAGEDIALNKRQAHCLQSASASLHQTGMAQDIAIVAEGLRAARGSFDLLTGATGVEDVLDSLFSRFCLGK